MTAGFNTVSHTDFVIASWAVSFGGWLVYATSPTDSPYSLNIEHVDWHMTMRNIEARMERRLP